MHLRSEEIVGKLLYGHSFLFEFFPLQNPWTGFDISWHILWLLLLSYIFLEAEP